MKNSRFPLRYRQTKRNPKATFKLIILQTLTNPLFRAVLEEVALPTLYLQSSPANKPTQVSTNDTDPHSQSLMSNDPMPGKSP